MNFEYILDSLIELKVGDMIVISALEDLKEGLLFVCICKFFLHQLTDTRKATISPCLVITDVKVLIKLLESLLLFHNQTGQMYSNLQSSNT